MRIDTRKQENDGNGDGEPERTARPIAFTVGQSVVFELPPYLGIDRYIKVLRFHLTPAQAIDFARELSESALRCTFGTAEGKDTP